jgi:hypothetical protein
MIDPGLDPILAYLRESYGRYSLAALRQQLLKNGYDVVDVDLAIQIFQHENPAARQPVWPKALVIALVNALLTMVASWPPSQQYWIAAVVVFAILICCVELVIALALMIPQRTRPSGHVLLSGVGLFAGLDARHDPPRRPPAALRLGVLPALPC